MSGTNKVIEKLKQTKGWYKAPSASSNEIEQLKEEVYRYIGHTLPEEYLDFLKWSNGGEGLIGKMYVAFWKSQEVVRVNREDHQIHKWWPNVLGIATDAGDYAYVLDLTHWATDGECPVYKIELGALFGHYDEATRLGDSFLDWLASLLQ